jgi:hypothetical protein
VSRQSQGLADPSFTTSKVTEIAIATMPKAGLPPCFFIDYIQRVYDARSTLCNNRDRTLLLAPGQFRACAASIGLEGTYPHTSEPYSVAYAITLWADLMPNSGRASKAMNILQFRATVAAMEAEKEEIEVSGYASSDSSPRIKPQVIQTLFSESVVVEVL